VNCCRVNSVSLPAEDTPRKTYSLYIPSGAPVGSWASSCYLSSTLDRHHRAALYSLAGGHIWLVSRTMNLAKGKDDHGWKSSTTQALSKVCRKRWRTLGLSAGSPAPPMRINCASGEFFAARLLVGGRMLFAYHAFAGAASACALIFWKLSARLAQAAKSDRYYAFRP